MRARRVVALAAVACAACGPRSDAADNGLPKVRDLTRSDLADLIVTNASVYTLTWPEPSPDGTPAGGAPFDRVRGWRPDAEAVAMKNGRIIFVGSTRAALGYKGSTTRVLDARGA